MALGRPGAIFLGSHSLSGFQSGVTATLGVKSASFTFNSVNTLTIVTPAFSAGPQQIVLTNPGAKLFRSTRLFLPSEF